MLGRLLLLLVIQLAKQGLIHARPSHDPGQTGLCPSTGLPGGGLRHLNVIHEGKPKYRLDLKHTKTGYVPGHTYTIYIRAQDPSQTFGDVLLSVSSESRTCQHGNFSTQSKYYYQPQGCDHMVLKNTRQFEHTFTFLWTAPTCGCVNLRARVKSADNIYYLDNENVIDGYLTKRVCRRHMSTIISKISHSERENLLCRVVSSSYEDIADEGHFLQRRKKDPLLMTALERDALKISQGQRIYQVQQCCVLTGTAKTDCLGDIRRHRIDQLCANTLHMPFSVRSNAYMTERRNNCCWRLGERRYDCFAMGHQGDGVPPQSDVHKDVAMVTGVNVLDESDPVNDLEDYPNRLSEELVQSNIYHEELENMEEVADESDIPHNDLVPTLASKVHNEPEKITDLPSYKTKQQGHQPVTAEIFPLQSPPKDLSKLLPTPQTVSLTQTTTTGLEKKLWRTQVELECCQQGKEYGAGLVTGDSWDRCEQRTRKVSKAKKGKNRRWCRRYHMRCCVESVHSARPSVKQEHNLETGATGRQRSEGLKQRVKVVNEGIHTTDSEHAREVDATKDTSTEVTMVTGGEERNQERNDEIDSDDNLDNDDDEESTDDSEETDDIENTTPAGQRSMSDRNQVARKRETSSSVPRRLNEDQSQESTDQSQESTDQSQGSTVQSQGSTDQSQGSTVQSQGSTDQSQGSTDQSQGSTVQSQGSTDQSQGSTDQSQGSTVQSQGSTVQSQGSTVQSQGSTDQSQGSTDQSQGSTDQSQGSTDQSQGSTDQSQGSTDHSQGSTDQSQDSIDQSQGSIDQSRGTIDDSLRSTDQVFSELPNTYRQLAKSSDLSDTPHTVETVKPSSSQQHSEIIEVEGKLRRRKRPKSTRKGRKSRRKGRKNRRRGRKQITT